MRTWTRVFAPLLLLTTGVAVGLVPSSPASALPVIPSGGSEVHAVIQVQTSPAYAGDAVHIDSSQLQAACGGSIVFETLQGGSTTSPHRTLDSAVVILDDDGNVTVVVDGAECAPGTDLVEADLTVAPFLTATTVLDIEPPQVTAEGVSAAPSSEVETGDTATSGDSDIYTVFTVETSPVYAEQPVEISSPQLEDRCITGWRIEPGSGFLPIDQNSGTSTAQGILDDDGNATFVFKGSSCAAGPSAVIADVEAGTHPTYVTTFTVEPPVATVASLRMSTKAAAHKHRKHHRGHGGSGSGAGSGTGSGVGAAPAPMSVEVSPNALVLTGVPSQGAETPESTLNVVKSDNEEGSSDGGEYGATYGGRDLIYTIYITNTGTTTLSDVEVYDSLSDDFDGATYSSVDNGGATGSGSGNSATIDDFVTLPPGSSIIYTIDTTVDCGLGQGDIVSNTVDLTPEGGIIFTPDSNFSATDYDYVLGNDCNE